jgi:hypothetical protein
MGRDHSYECDACGEWRGGFDDEMCACDRADPATAVAHALKYGSAAIRRVDGTVRATISIPPAEVDELAAERTAHAATKAECARLRADVDSLNASLAGALTNDPGEVAEAYRSGWLAGADKDVSLKAGEYQCALRATKAECERLRGVLVEAFDIGYDAGWDDTGEGHNGEYARSSFTAEKYKAARGAAREAFMRLRASGK